MMRCMRTAGSRTDSRIVDAGSGSQTAGLVQGSGPESRITAAQRAINSLTFTLFTHSRGAYVAAADLEPRVGEGLARRD